MSASAKKERKLNLRKNIAATLADSLADLRETLGEKKFNRNVKQAAKVLTTGLPKKKKEVEAQDDAVLTSVTAN